MQAHLLSPCVIEISRKNRNRNKNKNKNKEKAHAPDDVAGGGVVLVAVPEEFTPRFDASPRVRMGLVRLRFCVLCRVDMVINKLMKISY